MTRADKVQVYTAENEQDEAMHIADVIGEHLKDGGHLADHAVLYRMNAQSAPIESYLPARAFPIRSWAASASMTAKRSRTSTPICPSCERPG